MKRRRLVLYSIGLLGILLVPLVLNIVLIQERFCDRIIGNEETWLTFWGTYLGNIIAVLIPLYVLLQEIRHNKYENDKERKYQEIVRLKTDLAERISNINFTQITQSVLETDEVIPIKELGRLNDLCVFYTGEGNAMKILYGFSRRKEEREIAEGYYRCIECAVCIVNDLTRFLSQKTHGQRMTPTDFSNYQEILREMSEKCNDIQQRYSGVASMVAAYIQTVELEYSELK